MQMRENSKIIFGNSRHRGLEYIFRYLAVLVYDVIANLWLRIFPVTIGKKRYVFSLCTCFKNEASNLKEWIEYHKIIGIDHFFLYNNNSTDNYEEVLEPYIKDGLVTLIDFPQTPVQPFCYEHWIRNYRQETSWLAMIDVDEFFVPLKDCNIKDWLARMRRYPLLLVYWKMFGTSGQIEHDFTKLVCEQYTCSWPKLYDCGKIIYNTNYDIPIVRNMMHTTSTFHKGLKIAPVNVWGKFVFGGIHRFSGKEIELQLNHYWSGSYEKYREKQQRGDSAFTTYWKDFDAFLWHEHHNTSSDMSIYRFLVQLKLRMTGKYPESVDNGIV